MDKLDEAVAAYDAVMAESGVCAAGLFAAAVVLDLPVADTLNVFLARGLLDFVGLARPNDKVNGVVVRLMRPA